MSGYISCIRNFFFDNCQTSWTHKSMANNLLIPLSTSELDRNSLSCSILHFNSSVYFFDMKLCFDAMALLAWWSAPEVFSSENVNNKMNNHILFICYTIHLIHQFLKYSSCSLDNLPSIHWFMTKICLIQYFSWYN